MPLTSCPKHGTQFAMVFCDHAGAIIDERRSEPVYLQWNTRDWAAVCDACVRSPELDRILADVGCLVCSECLTEWSERTQSRFLERAREPAPERPEGMAPIPPELLKFYSDEELDSIDWMVALQSDLHMACESNASRRALEDIVRMYKDKGLMQKHAYESLDILVEQALPEDEALRRIGELNDLVTSVYSSESSDPHDGPRPGDEDGK